MPREPSPSDSHLVALALEGSADGYRALVERYQKPVLGLLSRMVHDRALAEDLAQEVFVRAFGKLATYDPERPFKSWLFKIAHNRAIDYLRLKRPEMVDLEASTADGASTWEVLEAPDVQSPSRLAESSEMAKVLELALAELRPNYREILLLRFRGELAYHEIAETLGITMASVKVLLHRARKALATELGARGFDPTELAQ